MTDTKKMRDVYVALADPTRRELISLWADVEELPLYVRLNRFKQVMENDSRLMNIQVKPKSDRKNWRN
ncbi:hypothetical protein ABEY41_23975 [Peribacillus butanolivorans]|uniref:hypothetical protein n=1 Tax=Peribacillus butanolivorans TaxID=421767 RepID=UPI003D28B62B